MSEIVMPEGPSGNELLSIREDRDEDWGSAARWTPDAGWLGWAYD